MLAHSRPPKLLEVAPAVYRPDIDGLRAVSILSVVWYHAFPAYAPGGFVGVDIFFVISGFLITRIIVTELATGAFSVAAFYRRRIRRIFPALIVVLVTTYAVGWLVLLPRDFKSLGENIAAGAAFFANLMQVRGEDYFAPAASNNPLLHLWSAGDRGAILYFLANALNSAGRTRRSQQRDLDDRARIAGGESFSRFESSSNCFLFAFYQGLGIARRRAACNLEYSRQSSPICSG
jgi:hypothetical protein